MNPLTTSVDGELVRTRRRAWLEEKGNPGEGPFLLDPNAPRQPRDIVIEEEVVVKIEVKEEHDEEAGLKMQDETLQENQPARKRVKLEDDDMGGIIVVTDEVDIPVDSIKEDREQEIEQATDDDMVSTMHAQVNEKTSPEIDDVVPPNVDDEMPPSATDIEAVLLQQQKGFKEISKLNSVVGTLTFKPNKATASTSVSCQTSSDKENYGASQIKILELFAEVIKVYWEKFARLQPNSRKLLNLDCRRVCKIWKEWMDKVLQGEHTPLKNIHTTVMIPHGDVETVKIVDQVPEAFKNIELTACPFFRATVMTHIAPQFSIYRDTVLELINSSGPDFELNSPVETEDEDPDTSEDEDSIASAFTSCQVGNDKGEHHDAASHAKILELFPEVIKVYWEKYARLQSNSHKLLNLNCRLACKPWKEGMDKVLEGEHTPLKNIYPIVIIPNGDIVGTVEIVEKVLEAYKNVDLAVCPFPPRILEIRDQNTIPTAEQTSLSRDTILKFINKFGQGLTEFKYHGIMGQTKLYQYTSAADWYLTVVWNWIGRMPYLEKLTMRNSLDSELSYPNALFRKQELSTELALDALLFMFPKLQNLKSFDRYFMPLSVITGALLVNTDKTGSSSAYHHSKLLLEMARFNLKSSGKLKSQRKQTNAKDVSYFLH